MDSFATFHPAHGALAGLAVYVATGKPLPALVVGGSLYYYMSLYGHSLPPALTPQPSLANIPTSNLNSLPTQVTGSVMFA